MDNKEKLLCTAMKLFVKEGFHGTSTSKIAKEAGVSNGTLFYYFKTKEELINKIYLKYKKDYRNYLLENIKPCKTFKGKIKQFWLSCTQWNIEKKYNLAFYDMFSNSPYIDKLTKEEASRNCSFIRELMQEAIDNEILMNLDIELIMKSFFSSIVVFNNFTRENSKNIEEYREIVFDMWWRSVVNI